MDRLFNCAWYVPCPICNKCSNVNEAKYLRCQNCGFSSPTRKCKHTSREIETAIKRKNFKNYFGPEGEKILKEIIDGQQQKME